MSRAKKGASADVLVDQSTMVCLVIHSFRYALGRRSTAPSTAADHVRRFHAILPAWVRAQIVHDIERDIRVGLAGDRCDVEMWRELAVWLAGQQPACACPPFPDNKSMVCPQRFGAVTVPATCADDCGGKPRGKRPSETY